MELKTDFSADKSSSQQYYGFVWNSTDRSQWRCPKFLVSCGFNGNFSRSGFCHSNWTMHGGRRQGGSRLLYEETAEDYLLASIVWNGCILLISPLVLQGYALSEEAVRLVLILILIHNVFNAGFYPLSGALSNGLRAAGDVRFTMAVSLISTLGCRLVFSVVLGIGCQMGVIGIAFAMCMDWGIRAAVFISDSEAENGRNLK